MGLKQYEFCECGRFPVNLGNRLSCPKSKWNKRHQYVPYSERVPKDKIKKYSGRSDRIKGAYERF